MLTAVKGPSRKITKVERKENALYLYSEYATHRLMAVDDESVRITFTREDEFSQSERPGIVNTLFIDNWDYKEDDVTVSFATDKVMIIIDKKTGSYAYLDKDSNVLLSERKKDSKCLTAFDTYKLTGDGLKTEKIQTPDGVKEIIKEASKEKIGHAYHAFHYLNWGDEALFGLGQHEEGYGSLRGRKLYVHQANRKSAVPMLVSTKGYGILTDTYSPFIFNDSVSEPYFYHEAVDELDYYFIYAGSCDGVIKEYRKITGKASMLPKWAFGYIQSKERYETAKEILDTVKESQRRGLGLDCMVLDWISWEDGMWGQKSFDRSRFEDPKAMTDALHDAGVKFMISIWPSMDEKTENRKEFDEKNLMLANCGVYNPFLKEGRDLYWEQLSRDLWASGVDAWWCDSSEPLTPEWSLVERPEDSANYHAFNNEMSLRAPALYSDAFCLYHALGVYEGQRGAMNESKKKDPSYKEKRVCNLTRSGTTGQQRLGTIMWSGDIEASYDTLKKQLGCGLNFSASGLPYWTLDIGAFFVKEGNFWYWMGQYEDPTNNPGYKELYTRWFQFGAFLPIFRAHGTDLDREMWVFGDEGDIFYDAMVKANKLRYELMPFIYSEAGKVWLEDKSLIIPLGFAFPEDKKVWNITDQYMFGGSIMVCPVTDPMYYDNEGNELKGVPKERKVYLPSGSKWFDFYTGKCYQGGQSIICEAPIDMIPLFVVDGSIIPMTQAAVSTAKQDKKVEFKVFSTRDCEYLMYEDDGDGYGYENGEYDLKVIKYNKLTQKVDIECK